MATLDSPAAQLVATIVALLLLAVCFALAGSRHYRKAAAVLGVFAALMFGIAAYGTFIAGGA